MDLDPALLEILACPNCRAELTVDDAAATVTLREVQSYFRDPARQLLAQQLDIRLDALEDDRLQADEPLQPGFSKLDQVGRRLCFDAIAEGRFELPEQPPAWLRLSGMLPGGRLGLAAWTAERDEVQALLQAAQAHPLFVGALPQRQPRALSLTVGTTTVESSTAFPSRRLGGRDIGAWPLFCR